MDTDKNGINVPLFLIITILFSLLLSNFAQAQLVSIPDPNLAAAIRQEIGDSITTDTILNLTRLDARNRGITGLTGLEHAHNLRNLNLSGEYIETEQRIVNSNAISDFSPITGLTQLTALNLSFCNISDVSFVSGLTQLTQLDLGKNSISDISALANLKQLNQLYLWGNRISDVSPLAELKKLTHLYLGNNSISDVSALTKLTQLTGLYLSSNGISDVSPLAELKKLDVLDLNFNNISDVSPLAELKQLTLLYLWGNKISDVSPLAELKKLDVLSLSFNNISDIAPLVKLNLTGTEWDRTGLHVTGNPLSAASINTHIPAMRAKGIMVAFDGSGGVLAQEISGEKIVGPWLWVIAPTGKSGADAAASGIDFLSEMSDGAVTEAKIATEGATAGAPVSDSVWTLHTLSATDSDNINDMAKATGLGIGDVPYPEPGGVLGWT